jgi:hypothetical protein
MWVPLVAALMGGLVAAMASLLGRVLIALGIGFVTYKGIDLAINSLKSQLVTSLSGMPADMVGLMGYLWVDKALTVIFSGFVVALSMQLAGGSVKKAVLK